MSESDYSELQAMLRKKWIGVYQDMGALWIHDDDPSHPHAELASLKHSRGYFNSKKVVVDKQALKEAAWDLIHLFSTMGGDLELIDRVVGPATGATDLAEFLAGTISRVRTSRRHCEWASPVKVKEADIVVGMEFNDPTNTVRPGERVLFCEDVITTGGSVGFATEACRELGAELLPFCLVLVNRSGLKEIDGKRIIALIDHPMDIWDPEDCPLCKGGSVALKPKIPEGNWELLTKPQ